MFFSWRFPYPPSLPCVSAIAPSQTCQKYHLLLLAHGQVSMDLVWHHRNNSSTLCPVQWVRWLHDCLIRKVSLLLWNPKCQMSASTLGQTQLSLYQLKQCSSTFHGCIQRVALTAGPSWEPKQQKLVFGETLCFTKVKNLWSQSLPKSELPPQ